MKKNEKKQTKTSPEMSEPKNTDPIRAKSAKVPAKPVEEELEFDEFSDDEFEEEFDLADTARVCPRCGKILIPGKPFCPNCGNLVDVIPESNPTRWEFYESRSAKVHRTAAIIGAAVGGTLALGLACVIFFYVNAAKTIQTDKSAIETAYADFIAETISFDDAVDTITPYLDSSHEAVAADAEKYLELAKEISESSENYSLGSTYMVRGEYYSAVKYFSAVSQNDDARYRKSVGLLKNCKRLFRTQAVSLYEKALAKDDIESAKEILAQLVEIFPDEDFGKRISDIENERLQEKIRDAEYWQEVAASRAVTYESGYSQSSRAGKVYVHNYNDFAVRKLHISVAMYDSDGVPLKNKDGEYILEMSFDDVDIPPGETATFTLRTSLPEDCALIKACVISARYSDERFWRNPFYDYWLAYRTEVYNLN
ncbi:MAG: hypothetical protein IK118_02205 [Clostridia bacterium]|nr:hypothetical protein [Clostridia bacterium]